MTDRTPFFCPNWPSVLTAILLIVLAGPSQSSAMFGLGDGSGIGVRPSENRAEEDISGESIEPSLERAISAASLELLRTATFLQHFPQASFELRERYAQEAGKRAVRFATKIQRVLKGLGTSGFSDSDIRDLKKLSPLEKTEAKKITASLTQGSLGTLQLMLPIELEKWVGLTIFQLRETIRPYSDGKEGLSSIERIAINTVMGALYAEATLALESEFPLQTAAEDLPQSDLTVPREWTVVSEREAALRKQRSIAWLVSEVVAQQAPGLSSRAVEKSVSSSATGQLSSIIFGTVVPPAGALLYSMFDLLGTPADVTSRLVLQDYIIVATGMITALGAIAAIITTRLHRLLQKVVHNQSWVTEGQIRKKVGYFANLIASRVGRPVQEEELRGSFWWSAVRTLIDAKWATEFESDRSQSYSRANVRETQTGLKVISQVLEQLQKKMELHSSGQDVNAIQDSQLTSAVLAVQDLVLLKVGSVARRLGESCGKSAFGLN